VKVDIDFYTGSSHKGYICHGKIRVTENSTRQKILQRKIKRKIPKTWHNAIPEADLSFLNL
jgi:hypothetical protein